MQIRNPNTNLDSALAVIAATVSANFHGRSFGGVTLLSPQGAKEAHGNVVVAPTFWGFVKTSFTNAGWNIFTMPYGMQDRRGAVGWFGLGGSMMMWHNDLDVGLAYTCTLMEADPGNETSRQLQLAVLDCVKAAT